MSGNGDCVNGVGVGVGVGGAGVDVGGATEQNSTLSICIPRVDTWVTEEYIRKVFNEVLLGNECNNEGHLEPIEKVDLIFRRNEKDETYKRAFIHFHNWHLLTSRAAGLIWTKINNGETIKIMHANPSYWKCSLNRVPRPYANRNVAPADDTRGAAFLVE